MATVAAIEYVTTEVTDLGQMARKIQVKALVRFSDNTKEWHYYGYPIPENPLAGDPPYFEHPEIRFPLCFINLPTGSDVIASGAVESAINLLNTWVKEIEVQLGVPWLNTFGVEILESSVIPIPFWRPCE